MSDEARSLVIQAFEQQYAAKGAHIVSIERTMHSAIPADMDAFVLVVEAHEQRKGVMALVYKQQISFVIEDYYSSLDSIVKSMKE
jgi:hypothetical protein